LGDKKKKSISTFFPDTSRFSRFVKVVLVIWIVGHSFEIGARPKLNKFHSECFAEDFLGEVEDLIESTGI
jgi:hypothetical protein